ncbi:hypothetical protein CHS0354_030104 [Potamilus streckersoni]|uniref:Cytochrome c oxidase subunit 2 n=1 Tax=Potamilus streckersoni TaxID=2493646 RepID=A0AAE0RLP1_9BIVA|nr:hypothetical protein CHS0354_030104 [Potamilus streckersoni]
MTGHLQYLGGLYRDFKSLTKPGLVLWVYMSVLAGYALSKKKDLLISDMLYLFAGRTYLISIWSAKATPKCSVRVTARLLQGKLVSGNGFFIAFVMSLAGYIILFLAFNPLTAFTGLLCTILYVFAYTPLKKKSAWNTWVGALPGALPALIGGAAVVNHFPTESLYVSAVLYVWQIPHFLALAWKYRKEYAEADVHPIMKLFGMGQAPQSTITPENGITNEINDLYALLGWIGLGIPLVVFVIFLVIVIRFRESKNKQAKDSHGNTLLEILWTAIPLIILIVITVPTIRLIFKMETRPDLVKNPTVPYTTINGNIAESPRYLEMNVVAHQWWWEFEYVGMHERKPGEDKPVFTPLTKKVGANEIWLPLNVPVKFNITSEDVIHSFWVPRLMGKVDAIPGRINFMTFVVEKEGYYYGVCAEYCGASHALMRFNIVGVTEEKFNSWANWGQGEVIAESESAKRGQVAFQTCLGCHTMNGMRPFESRQVRLDRDMQEYMTQKEAFVQEEKAWHDEYMKDKSGHIFRREILTNPDRPVPPVKPVLYRDNYRTTAPDLTDLRYRKRLFASIHISSRDMLRQWIKNPPKVKPEMMGTPVIRMPAYEGILEEQTIDDIVEFLMTVKYADTPNEPADIEDLFAASVKTETADAGANVSSHTTDLAQASIESEKKTSTNP